MSYATASAAWEPWSLAEARKHFVKVCRLPDGTFDAFPEKSLPDGVEVLDPQPPRPTKGQPHQATTENMKKLEEKYPNLIAWGCYYAVQIARANLTVHSREVRAKMADAGLVDDHSGPEHWMGVVFKRLKSEGVLTESGNRYKYSSESRGIHEREVKIWILQPNADFTKYNEKPTRIG